MAEAGIDINQQHSKPLRDYMGKIHFGYLITVCSEAEERCPRAFPGMGQRINWNLEHPAAFEGLKRKSRANSGKSVIR
jgi:arsenate reductase